MKCSVPQCNEMIHPRHLLLSKQVQVLRKRDEFSPCDLLPASCVACSACRNQQARDALSEARWLPPRPAHSVSGTEGEGSGRAPAGREGGWPGLGAWGLCSRTGSETETHRGSAPSSATPHVPACTSLQAKGPAPGTPALPSILS